MTTRRRVATFSFSPETTSSGGAVATSVGREGGKTDLERKLELLEARFTMPLLLAGGGAANGNTNGGGSNNNNNSSPATLDPENSSPASVPSTTNHNNNNNSQQSFGFDTPSLNYQETERISTSQAAAAITATATTAANHTDVAAAAAAAGWQEIAAAHMAKMALQSQSQDQTLLTSHVASQKRSNTPNAFAATEATTSHLATTIMMTTSSICVKESPPYISPKAIAKETVQPKQENKRKSVMPVKRSQHSVKENLSGAPTSTEAPKQPEPRKRTRLQFDPASIIDAPEKKQSTETDDVLIHNNSPISSAQNNVTAKPSTGSNSPLFRRMMTSNNTSNSKQQLSEHSREPPASKASKKMVNCNAKISDFFTSTKKRSSGKPASISQQPAPTATDDGNRTVVSPLEEISALNNNTLLQQQQQQQPRPKSAEAVNTAQMQQQGQQLRELELLKQRYEELQRTCQDKDEQLKAVSNNRTILHTALQSSLRQREQEIEALQQSTEEQELKYRSMLEELVRTDAGQEARELREKLAVDGARLGRIVAVPAPTRGPPRMLMQRAVIESWEDGRASKELYQRRKELQAKRAVLEERQTAALRAEERVLKQLGADSKDVPTGNPGDEAPDAADEVEEEEENMVVGGVAIRTALDAREAVESVRFHLDNVRRQEQEIALEEQALNDEKGAHIRALKRVASEDASRFRSRPKLHDRYVLRSLLGKGGFSEVWRAFDLVELREVAVKIHQLDSRWPEAKKENYTKHVSREYEIHRSVRHPRLVSLFDVFEIDNNSFATVLESCDGTDLDTLLKTKRRLPERDARAILLQILSGMNYLSHPSPDGSRQGVIHYDLKPGNILFDEYGDAKITDFGLSKIVDTPDPAESMELTSQGAGTYWYLPPECFVLEENVRISNKVDVWSIGVIFYQMLFGKRPFGDGQSQDKILTDGTMLNAHSVTFPDKPEVTDACKDFVRACLTYDQRFRPTIAQICQHSYVLTRGLF